MPSEAGRVESRVIVDGKYKKMILLFCAETKEEDV